MKTYAVYIKDGEENAVFVKEGFLWFAAIFQILWTLYHKMWLVSFILFAIAVVLALLKQHFSLDENLLMSVNLGIFLFFGFSAGDLWEKTLLDSGYKFSRVIMAENIEEARYRFYKLIPDY